MKVPLFNQPVGMGIDPQAPSLGAAASRMPVPDIGPSQARAQFEGQVRAEQRQLDDRLISAGFQLAHQAIKAREEIVFQRQKRAFMYGGDPEERFEALKERVAGIANSARTSEMTPDGQIVYDSQKAGSQIRSVAELQEFLAQTSYQNWEDIIDNAIPMIEDHVLSNSGSIARGRFREWVKESAGDMRLSYTLKAAQMQMQITRQSSDDEIQQLVSSGDSNGAFSVLYSGLNQGIYSAHEVVMISTRINAEAPLHKYTNEGLSELRTVGPDGADDTLNRYLEKLQERIIQGNPVQRTEDGEYNVLGVTEAQFDEIRTQLTSERDKIIATDIRQKNTLVDVAAANLYESMVDGTLTPEYLDEQGLVEMRYGPARSLDAEYRDYLASMQEQDLQNMQVARGEEAQIAINGIMDRVMEDIMRGKMNEQEIQGVVRELSSMQITVGGEQFRVLEREDAAAAIKDFLDLHKSYSPYRNVYDSFESALRTISSSRKPEDRAAQEIENGRMRHLWRRSLNDLLQANTPPDQIDMKMREIQDNLIKEASNGAITELVSSIRYSADMIDVDWVVNTYFTDDNASISSLALGKFNNFQSALDEKRVKGFRSDPETSAALFGHSLVTEQRLQRDMGANLTERFDEPSGQPVIGVPLTVNGISPIAIPERYKRTYDGRENVQMRYQMINGESVPIIKNQDLNRWDRLDTNRPLAEALGFVFPPDPETRPLSPAEIEARSRTHPTESATTEVVTEPVTPVDLPGTTLSPDRTGPTQQTGDTDTSIMGRPNENRPATRSF